MFASANVTPQAVTVSRWCYLTKEFPSRGTVNRYFCLWNSDGTRDRLHQALYVKCRAKAERDARPAAYIIDSETREVR